MFSYDQKVKANLKTRRIETKNLFFKDTLLQTLSYYSHDLVFGLFLQRLKQKLREII